MCTKYDKYHEEKEDRVMSTNTNSNTIPQFHHSQYLNPFALPATDPYAQLLPPCQYQNPYRPPADAFHVFCQFWLFLEGEGTMSNYPSALRRTDSFPISHSGRQQQSKIMQTLILTPTDVFLYQPFPATPSKSQPQLQRYLPHRC